MRAPPVVFVLVPFAREGGALVSPYYDTPELRRDVASWMAALGARWEWVSVTIDGVEQAVRRVAREAPAIALNLCDGDDVNGYPGLSVVRALAAAGVAHTGADAAFYALSTSKLAMKRRFVAAGVATAPWVEIAEPARDVARAERALGLPFFLKPDVSFGSAGITVRSVIRDRASGVAQAMRLFGGMHGCRFAPGAIFAEPFLPGPEYTVLLFDDPRAPDGVRVLAPCERVFHPGLPPLERYLTFERYCEEYDEDPPPPPGEPYYRYAAVEAERAAPLAALARAAYRAVGGHAYARVDLRVCGAGAARVLEVNANCGLSSDDTSTAGAILAESGCAMAELIGAVLAHGWRRRHGATTPPFDEPARAVALGAG
ncbi:MAG: hypothetical protein KF729_27435 [Sandaracinaceae bacterium]|nr:hypothetical protein [Sandaracinaceae bacterium]